MKKILGLGLMIVTATLFAGGLAYAQSTTIALPIAIAPGGCQPDAGVCYISMTLRAASIYQKANWYTQWVTKDSKGNLLVNIDGHLETTAFSDAKASDPVQLHKNGADVNVSLTAPLLRIIPMTFNDLTLKFQFTRTAKDGADALLALLADQSKVGAFALSQATLGVATATKAIADFLFKQDMIDSRLSAQYTISLSNIPTAGTYAFLGCDDAPSCNKFVPELKYDATSGTLSSKIGAVVGVSWIVFDVSYQARRYSTFNAALSFKKSKSWAALYSAALTKATGGTWTIAQHDQVESELRKQIEDANALLLDDADLTQDEKMWLVKEANKQIDTAYKNQYAMLLASAAPITVTGATPVTEPPPVVNVGGVNVPTTPEHLDLAPKDLLRLADGLAAIRAAKK